MLTTHAPEDERALDTARHDGDLPQLSAVDRIALKVGVALILWGRQHAERQDRAATARWSGAAEDAAADRRLALEHRAASGTTW